MAVLFRLLRQLLITLLLFVMVWSCGGLGIFFLIGRAGVAFTLVVSGTLVALLAYLAVWNLPWAFRSLPERGKWLISLLCIAGFSILTIAIFAFPIRIPALNRIKSYETLNLSEGEKIALYHFAPPGTSVSDTPILFVNGGPGGPLSSSVAKFLSQLAAMGFDVYTFDHYTSGYSQLLGYNLSLLTIADEVRRVHEIMNHLGTPKTFVLGHSYAGALLGRVAAQYPTQIAKLVFLDTSPLYDLGSGNLKSQVTQDPQLAELLKADEDSPEPGNTIPFVANLSLRENVRGLLMLLMNDVDGKPAFGNNKEWGFYLEAALVAQLGKKTITNSPRRFSGISGVAQLVNEDIARQPDYADALIKANTPPVLLVHPENGVVPWPIHKDYENFFDSVIFLPVPDAEHGVWEKPQNARLLKKSIHDFLLGKTDSTRFYQGRTDPFLKSDD